MQPLLLYICYLLKNLTLQLLEAKTVCAIFKNNLQLCREVRKRVIQHFVQCIEDQGRHEQYLEFLQTIVKAEGQFIRENQDAVMHQVSTFGLSQKDLLFIL